VADLTAHGTSGAGLGTRAGRWALVSGWVLGVLSGWIAGALARPVDLLAYLLALVGAVVLTGRGDDVLRRGSALAVVLCAAGAAALTVSAVPVKADPWLVDFSFYLVALLIPRGNGRSGALGAAVLLAIVLAGAQASSATARELIGVLTLPATALMVGIVWRVALARIVVREHASRSRAARLALALQVEQEAARRSRSELSRIRDLAEPLLREIAQGADLDPARRHRLSIGEAAIRDRIRSPQLQHPALVAAVARRRQAGVRVLLLGEAEEGAAGGGIGDALVDAVVQLLEPVVAGSVTIRAIPAGRGAAVSVLLTDSSRTERVLVAADGTVIERG